MAEDSERLFLPEDLAERLRAHAAASGSDLSLEAHLRQAVEDYLEDQEAFQRSMVDLESGEDRPALRSTVLQDQDAAPEETG
ncbi:MAG: ribbon-helix-helix protein, CopG family [Rhodospirillaceae bacterium]